MICLITAAGAMHAADTRSGEVALHTELKVSGPLVFVRGPLGLRYRPGYAFPLEVRVHNPGPEFRGQLLLLEGDDASGARSGIVDPVSFPAQGSRIFVLPTRAPAVSANVSVLIREIDSHERLGPLRFQASLARTLKPLSADARLVLNCGATPGAAQFAQQDSIPIRAADLPGEPWMYESLDLVILTDGTFKDSPPAAKAALRRWLLGGGRMLVSSSDALSAVIAANLLPIDPAATGGLIGSDRAWWEKHAGLKQPDILAEKNNRPVYAKLNHGFGTLAFLFPGSSAEVAGEFGAAAVNHPALQSARERFPDLRVQPDRYNAFVFGGADSTQREQAALWIALGALVFCVGLALGWTSRSRWLAAGWPLTVAALLGVMLAKWFPARELSASRIELVRQSADTAALARTEWTLLEAFQQPVTVTAAGPRNGTLLPLYVESSEIRRVDLTFAGSEERLLIQDLRVAPEQSMLLAASLTELPAEKYAALSRRPPALSLRSREGALSINADPFYFALAPGSALVRTAVLARSNGSLLLLEKLGDASGFESRKFDDWVSVLRRSKSSSDDQLLRARATALSWASREALRSGRDTLIFWSESGADEETALLTIEDLPLSSGRRFHISAVQVNVKE